MGTRRSSEIYALCAEAGFSGALIKDAPMSAYTTFKIGGPAAALLEPSCENDVDIALKTAKTGGFPCFVMGNGSNLLVRDEGFEGLIIRFGQAFADISCEDGIIRARAGALLPKIAQAALAGSLAGFEFACGIPGSAGGALVMNAGAYGGEMSQAVDKALIYSGGELKERTNAELGLSYRHSALMGSGAVVLSVEYRLSPGEGKQIAARMEELKAKRSQKQPVNLPSAGSAFKRPKGGFAAKLIEDCGLKGLCVGGAMISCKHAGFIVNTGGATAADVLELTGAVHARVLSRTGISLEREFIVL